MIGFNGGLIGKNNPTIAGVSIPGVWTPREQEVAVRKGSWSSNNVLNQYPGAAAAFSLRPLSQAALSANVVRVRRSSGSPSEENFTSIQVTNGELETWVGAGNNGFVTIWYDQSANNNNATQTTAGNQPQIVANGSLILQNSKPSLQFSEDGTFMNANSLIGRTRLDSYIVKNTSDLRYILFTATDSNGFSVVAESGSAGGFAGTSYGSPTVYANNVTFAGTTRNQLYVFLNGYKLEVQENANTTSWTSFQFGRWASGGGFNFAGKIQEIIFYPSNQSSNRIGLQNIINAHYSIY